MARDNEMTAGQGRNLLEEARAALIADPGAAAALARKSLAGDPGDPRAHRLLAAALRRLGRHSDAALAEADAIGASARSPQLVEAAKAMREKQVEKAERILRTYLHGEPDDPQALRMLAEIAAVCGHGGDAECLLRRALEEAPGFVPLYINLAALLQDLGRADEAFALLDEVLQNAPGNEMVLSFKAESLAGVGRMDDSLKTHEELLALAPDAAAVWMNYGHALKATGRGEEAAAAYRNSLKRDPSSGYAWWALANMRTMALREQDAAAIEQALAAAGDDFSRVQLHFALGRALGDLARFEASFRQYEMANDLRRVLIPYDPEQIAELTRTAQAMFAPAFFEKRAGLGCPAPDPIFIVGLPRSGSTLVEQILASHPSIEGAGELYAMELLADALALRSGSPWIDAVETLSADALRALGEGYLASAGKSRRAKRPFFTDKMPYNWAYVGLIHCILPNARIIDVRRHPMACCFSNFATYFNRSTNFASGLGDIGRYYCAYAGMMEHFDRVAPGKVHRVLYEDLVDDVEGTVRSLLEYLDLPFDENCLRFYESRRAVHTPSALQVRRPISAGDADHWRNYEPWLAPLKAALTPVKPLAG